MIRSIYIPPKEIQVIDLRNLCKRKKQLEAVDSTLCPPSTLQVNGFEGEILEQKIKSGAFFNLCLVNSNGDRVGTLLSTEGATDLDADLELDL